MQTKQCSRCHEVKSLQQFRRTHMGKRAKYIYWCMDCYKAYHCRRHVERKNSKPILPPSGKKNCRTCGRTKTLEQFKRNYNFKDHHGIHCLKCESLKDRHRSLWERYGILPQQFVELVRKQRGRCAVCGKRRHGKRLLCVDHDHTTGKIRALLCHRCNTKTGQYESLQKEPQLLVAIQKYLDSFKDLTEESRKG